MRIESSRPRATRGACVRSLFERLISTTMLAVLLLSPGGLCLLPSTSLAGPIADPFAPVGVTPQIVSAPNGVPMVHCLIGLRGAYKGLSYDLFVGQPIVKPTGFVTASTTAGFNLNWAF